MERETREERRERRERKRREREKTRDDDSQTERTTVADKSSTREHLSQAALRKTPMAH